VKNKHNKVYVDKWTEEPVGFSKNKEYGLTIFSLDKSTMKDIKNIVDRYRRDRRV